MSAKNTHPGYDAMLEKWERGRDCYNGDDAIKEAGTKYLPPTSGMIEDGQGAPGHLGEKAYQAYKLRAYFPDIYREAVEAVIGIMHREPPSIELPPKLEGMLEDATLLGESLEMVLQRINAQQLITGRVGVLGDIKVHGSDTRPVVVLYEEKAIRNWDDTSENHDDVDVSIVVLDETGHVMDSNLTWTLKEKYRILALMDNAGTEFDPQGNYMTAVLDGEADISSAEFKSPNLMGEVLDMIPFVFINSKDLSPSPDSPPLDGLAKLCLTIYRGEADYRQNLFMQSQDTLVRIGANGDEDDIVRTGAGARIDVPIGGDAKFIGVSSTGLGEQRSSLENDYSRAVRKSGQLVDSTSRAKESGDALRVRVAAQTATLPQIAKAGAAGLQKVLRALAVWQGEDPERVIVKPNLNFTEADLNGENIVKIMAAKGLGAPISYKSIHTVMKNQGFTKMSFEDEEKEIDKEPEIPGRDIPSPVDRVPGQHPPAPPAKP